MHKLHFVEERFAFDVGTAKRRAAFANQIAQAAIDNPLGRVLQDEVLILIDRRCDRQRRTQREQIDLTANLFGIS